MSGSWFLILVLLFSSTESHRILNEFVSYYEPIFYSKSGGISYQEFSSHSVQFHRWSGKIEIDAFGRKFKLQLNRASRVLSQSSNVTVYGVGGSCDGRSYPSKSVLNTLVEGTVFNESKSYVHGSLSKGKFIGTIRVGNSSYYVEKAAKFFNEKVAFDAVIYRDVDVKVPKSWTCQQKQGPPSKSRIDSRSKNDKKGNICKLKVIADSTFYDRIGSQQIDSSIQELVFHVTEADHIFRDTDFVGDGTNNTIGFQIESLELYMMAKCFGSPSLSKDDTSAEEFLLTFSERNFSDFCVGVAASGHSFPGNVLGISFMADPSGRYFGGICDPPRYIDQFEDWFCFNTAAVTQMVNGKMLPRAVSSLVLAHELGHSFGSEHDPPGSSECSPSDSHGGRYLMAAYASSGDKPNNRKFSPCSIREINAVVKKRDCLIPKQMLINHTQIEGRPLHFNSTFGDISEQKNGSLVERVHRFMTLLLQKNYCFSDENCKCRLVHTAVLTALFSHLKFYLVVLFLASLCTCFFLS